VKLNQTDKDLLKAALYDAIEWERSFYECIKHTDDELTKKKTLRTIEKFKAFRTRLFEPKKPILAIDDKLYKKLCELHPELKDPYASRCYILMEMYKKHNMLVMPLHEIEQRALAEILSHVEKLHAS
jgi:hypothetical protein